MRTGNAPKSIAALANAELPALRAAGLTEIRSTTRALHARNKLIQAVLGAVLITFQNAVALALSCSRRLGHLGNVAGFPSCDCCCSSLLPCVYRPKRTWRPLGDNPVVRNLK